ncbi:MAG: Carbohydrate binding family 6 [Gammaproteobacteria bacterium]|nr:Carbohydrate binding family 6 [Gammaproteobacteria bacterium]
MRDTWVRTFIVLVARVGLAALVSATVSPTGVLAQTTGGARTTLPSPESVRSLLMSNWTDFLAIHQARQLYPKDTHLFGPYLAALHGGVDWTTPQIDGATAFFHAEVLGGASSGDGQGSLTGSEQPPTLCESSGNVTGDNAPANPGLRQSYPSIMCFDDGGVMNVEYLRETERGLPIQIQKSYAMVPHQHFLVVRYTLTNNIPRQYNKQVLVRFAEVAQLHNKQAQHYLKAADSLVDTGLYQPPNGQPLDDLQAQWHPELNAWIADMSVANGTYLVFGAFQDMDRHRVFDPGSEQVEFDRAMAPEMDNVDQPGPPQSVEQLTAGHLGLSAWKQVVIDPGAQQQYSFFYAVAATVDEAQQIARQARSSTVDNWFNQTRQAYQAWLQKGKQVQIPDAGLRSAYTRGLITTKQSQQPEFGSFVAATNPAYGYKVWPRDSSVTALGLVASGHLDEAVKFFQWMASVQEDGTKSGYPTGTWFSNYSFWLHKGPKYFREPEWDSLGLFMIGVYRTWQALQQQNPQAADDFLTGPIVRFDQGPTSVYEAVRRTAEYLKNNINDKGYAPGDYSIWEEDFEWATFTQTASASGLNAAHLLAAAMGEPDRANDWLNSARHILNTIHRAASAQPCPGLWNDNQVRWNRATWINCTPDDRLDAASSLVWVFGLVLANDQRADQQRNAVLARLNPRHDGVGIARYEGDEFYHAKPYSPGGAFESSVSMPAWPQLDMYLALLEHWRGLDDVVLRRLQFYASVTAVGYMPPGEAIDWQTGRPLVSTSSEPVTAAWNTLGLMNYLNIFDPRLAPLGP